MKKLLFIIIAFLFLVSVKAQTRWVGGDISMFQEYQAAGSQYHDENGNPISLLPYLHELGMNAMRVRLFVDPAEYTIEDGKKKPDSNVCQSLPYIIPLCQDIIANGLELMLDFHYSDTWADPGKQYIPDAWKDLTDEQLKVKIYDYTKESLQTLKENGITPKFIQPGNEISYGMLWVPFGKEDDNSNHVWDGSSEASWTRFGDLLKGTIRACREVCPESEIIIHTERVAQVGVLTNFYDRMKSLEIDYDIIGLSYYPYFHGNMAVLNNALTALEARYPEKPIMIVETGFPYAWAVPGSSPDYDHDYTLADQNAYAHELVDTLLEHPSVNGLFWWWLEYNAYGSKLSGWYNAPLFDSRTGNATPALKTIASFSSASAGINDPSSPIFGVTSPNEGGEEEGPWYDLSGRAVANPSLPGIYIHNGRKIIVSP